MAILLCMATKHTSVDEYLKTFPKAQRTILSTVRQIIRERTPGGGEAISHGMPNLTYRGRSLVQFGGWSKHVGFYGLHASDFPGELGARLKRYESDKATLKFPYQDFPYELVEQLVDALVAARDAEPAAPTEPDPLRTGPLFGRPKNRARQR